MTGPRQWLTAHRPGIELFFAGGAFLGCVAGAVLEHEKSWPALAALMALNWLLRVLR